MKDHMVKAVADGFRIFAAVTTRLAEEARARHRCYPVAAAALGRTMTGALLLAANLKNDECVTLKIAGDGPLGQIVADANPKGYARGYVDHPQTDLPLSGQKLAVGEAVGKGLLSVTRFTGLKQPFQGSVALVSGEIAEDITEYLYVSEQTPSSVGLGVLIGPELDVLAAGGFFIQVLPDAPSGAVDRLEDSLKRLPPVSEMVSEGLDGRRMIEKIMAGTRIDVLEETELRFCCQCSKERIERVLLSLGQTELASLAADGKAEVCCHFCAEKYQFTKAELERLRDAPK